MQPIVIAIDFSNTSLHALDYAISMSNRIGTNLHLIWVDKISMQESVYPDLSYESKNEIKKRFDELISQYKGKLNKGLSLEYKLRKGKVYREIDNYARSVDAGLIIAGTHGISGYEEYWIGSNAYKIVSFTSIPVITVRHDYPVDRSISRILALMDGSNETIQKIPYTAKLARLFDAEVILLTTHNNNLKSIQRIAEKFSLMASNYLKDNNIKVTEDSFVSSNLTKSALEYTVSCGADLISIMTEQETPVNVHIGAQAQQLISQSPVPVLSVTPVEKFSLTSLI